MSKSLDKKKKIKLNFKIFLIYTHIVMQN
jgi:hypothetical protein